MFSSNIVLFAIATTVGVPQIADGACQVRLVPGTANHLSMNVWQHSQSALQIGHRGMGDLDMRNCNQNAFCTNDCIAVFEATGFSVLSKLRGSSRIGNATN